MRLPRVARTLAASVLVLGIVQIGCASDAAGVDEIEGVGDVDDGEGEAASEDALSTAAIADYVAVAPPEARITRSAVSAKLGPGAAAGRTLFVIRSFTLANERVKLVVDGTSLATSVISARSLDSATRAAERGDRADETPYTKSLAAVDASDRALTSVAAGAELATAEPFALTIDMCQSRKPWEKRLFDWAVTLSDQLRQPVPVGIAMTGVWARTHPAELEQLLSWERGGKLAITWINHSSTHPLHCQDASCRRAQFLTAPSVDFDEEVMGEERVILARGMVPSPIFRFPGLVHDARRRDQLARLSLVPLDADAWIAKGQPIRPRAVVLVHGNGNEPEGIVGFLRQVGTPARSAALRAGQSALVSPLLVAPVPPR